MKFARQPATKALSYTNGFPCFFNCENYQPDPVYEQKKLDIKTRQANKDWQFIKLQDLNARMQLIE